MGPADAAVEGHREAMASSAPGLRLLRLSKRMRRVSSSQEVLQCRVIIDSTQVYIPLRASIMATPTAGWDGCNDDSGPDLFGQSQQTQSFSAGFSRRRARRPPPSLSSSTETLSRLYATHNTCSKLATSTMANILSVPLGIAHR
jgi:hypothetical protein